MTLKKHLEDLQVQKERDLLLIELAVKAFGLEYVKENFKSLLNSVQNARIK